VTHISRQRDLQWPTNAQQRASDGTRTEWDAAPVANAKSDLFLVAAICAIGLLTTIDVMLRWPDLGALIASCNQF
jgi:hypothetical protein